MPSVVTSAILAKFWGILITVICLILLLWKERYKAFIAKFSDEGLLYFSGFFALIIGSASVAVHNLWVSDWRAIITIFGYASIAKGVLRLSAPELVFKWAKKFENSTLYSTVLTISLILGLYLLYIGFIYY